MSGKLIYLMGPSGSGKDSLIEAARPYLAERGCEVMRRVITRSAESVGEDAQSVSAQTFEALKEQGAFALHWQAHGLSYGITTHLDDCLRQGRHVLVNGSRAYLRQARERYPDLVAVMLCVNTEVLHERLLKRGRETLEQIRQRLQRNELFLDAMALLGDDAIEVLDNSASITVAERGLLALIDDAAGYPASA
ncbi:phosphonate metabolism protein/1,5-bisphosphokinase (PRPP-forming) PhnN [Pseudomonas lundensis]|uniref:Ribose 1,5-bisphosphate phosphokinase PhnN n=1 Tax=Pseudomonas lundensis TaxID=86185 RepID=A0AAX2H4W5_9PSED|nr:phosphonate metabolism protein/1,5-bisphosphokinase (PRPP-forming) PhnN [Pseudomonas lundensis]SOB50553.1 Ribose 1,5-bisphosphate phosphokinase PhnN [Pseudomonas lundensis]